MSNVESKKLHYHATTKENTSYIDRKCAILQNSGTGHPRLTECAAQLFVGQTR